MKPLIAPVEYPELIVGLAGPIGVNIEKLTLSIEICLNRLEYKTQQIRLTEELERFRKSSIIADGEDFYNQIKWRMDCANEFRKSIQTPDALSRIAIKSIREYRKTFSGDVKSPAVKQAYIIRQLKLPEEVHLLRRTYGRQFILISAYSSEEDRKKLISEQISKTLPTDISDSDISFKASSLIARDAREEEDDFGQNLRETFHLGDAFVHGSDSESMKYTVERFFEAFFGRNDITPSRDEHGMYTAKSASLRSADLSRQVGAAIFSSDGDIVTHGCNEVARSGGGNYWDGDKPDNRDVKKGNDPNEILKTELIRNIIERLLDRNMLSKDLKSVGNSFKITEFLTKKDNSNKGALADSKVMDITEFGRVVHAEMNAICDAARIGKSIKNSTLYCTTFPCHNCTKHIIASGLKKVVYMEPYPKSKAAELFCDEIQIESEGDQFRVAFLPFLGISPIRYRDIFQKKRRKNKNGAAEIWYFGAPKPMIEIEFPSYPTTTELWALAPLLGSIENG